MVSSSSDITAKGADKRAHHNALERKRRDHIKDSFHSLRDSVPALQGEKQSIKQASRAQILDKATEYIQYMRRKNHTHQQIKMTCRALVIHSLLLTPPPPSPFHQGQLASCFCVSRKCVYISFPF
uniref:Protein max n=1 Tax=Gadus morhua TaxID=8049 RepID=A0A8C5CEZ4_GADMO